MRTRMKRESADDRGVVLIIVALCMIAMLVMVAIVVDLGRQRADKRADQTMSDLAALAAGFYLSGRGSTLAVSNPQAACRAAVNSVATNQPTFTASDARCGGYPTDARTCRTDDPPLEVPFGPSGGFTLHVRYPIPDAEIVSLAGQRYSFTADDGIVAGLPNASQCQRMKVTVDSTSSASFAQVIGVNTLDTSASAIVKSSTSQTQKGVAALLLLERVGCSTLQNSGQGSVLVEASGSTNPGVIQADTAGIPGAAAPVPCGNNNNGNAPNWSVYGPPLPGGGGPSILVQDAPNGQPGVIGTYSLNVGGRGGAVYPGGLSSNPVGSGIASRAFADEKYNQPVVDGGNAQISGFHADGIYFVTRNWGQLNGGEGYTLRLNGPDCKNYVGAPTDLKIFVDCPNFDPSLAIFPNATDIVFGGQITIGANSVLSLPVAQRVYVRGNTGGGYAVQVKSGGSLLVNTGEVTIPSPGDAGTTCASRPGPGVLVAPPSVYGTFTNTTRFATFGGSFESPSGFVRLCQTFLYLGDNTGSYVASSYTRTASGGPEGYPAISACSTTQPCPRDNTNNSFISITGGSNVGVEWTAPNQLNTVPTTAQLAYPNANPFEDLALWTENSSISNVIKGQGANSTTGVYFIPNGSAKFTGQASQAQPLNAQFIVRALDISGQGSLVLKPNPADAIQTPIAGAIKIIR